MAEGEAKIAPTIIEDTKTTVPEDEPLSIHLKSPCTSDARDRYYKHCRPLYNAAMKGDWEAANLIIQADPTVVRARITEGGETALHISATGKNFRFVVKLVEKMNPADLEITNWKGNTALTFAALDGSVAIAELMIKAAAATTAITVMVDNSTSTSTSTSNRVVRSLADICGKDGVKPLYIAALCGHRDMVNFLYETTDVGGWDECEKVKLLITCINSSLLDTALNLVHDNPKLTVVKDDNGETALHVLARSPSIFVARNQDGILRRFIKFQLQGENSTQTQALELLKCLLENLFILPLDGLNISEIIKEAPALLFAAAYSGNTEFLISFLESFPDVQWKSNEDKQTIFHVAVKNRDERIFNMLQKIGSVGKVIATQRDKNDNNLLHLAANSAPPSNILGAALKMQHEILWFKKVEKVVQQPKYRGMKNSGGKTPQDLFTENHNELMKEAKQWMKDTAKSSIILSTSIAALVFPAFINLPDSSNSNSSSSNNGPPTTLTKNDLFGVLSISEGLALTFSTISTLLFLSIYSSRYAESDFLRSLPLRLVLGMMTLFVSMAAMMVAICTIFLLFFPHDLIWINVAFSFVAPVLVVFVLLKCILCLDIIRSTHCTCIGTLFRPRPGKKRLFDIE